MYQFSKVNKQLTWGGVYFTKLNNKLTFFYRGIKVD